MKSKEHFAGLLLREAQKGPEYLAERILVITSDIQIDALEHAKEISIQWSSARTVTNRLHAEIQKLKGESK